MNTLSLERVVDDLIDAYVDWHDACVWVNDAYRFWARQADSGDGVAFRLYMATLDAEERAAVAYAASVRRVYERLWGEGSTARALDGRARRVGRR